jgi:hypothetical protein
MAGYTNSINFPMVGSSYQAGMSGWFFADAFLAKFDNTGNLIYSTFLGGTAVDHAKALAIDSTDSVYMGVGDWDYTLQSGRSDAIDTGNPEPAYNDADGSRNDMGAFGGQSPNEIVF